MTGQVDQHTLTGWEDRHQLEELGLAYDVDAIGGSAGLRWAARKVAGIKRPTTADLVRRYHGGESIRAIAGATGVAATTVHRRLVGRGPAPPCLPIRAVGLCARGAVVGCVGGG
jgi:hypothetical protein